MSLVRLLKFFFLHTEKTRFFWFINISLNVTKGRDLLALNLHKCLQKMQLALQKLGCSKNYFKEKSRNSGQHLLKEIVWV